MVAGILAAGTVPLTVGASSPSTSVSASPDTSSSSTGSERPTSSSSAAGPGLAGADGRPLAAETPAAEGGGPSRAAPAAEGTRRTAAEGGRSRARGSGWATDPLSRLVIAAGLVPETARPDDPASVLAARRRDVDTTPPATITDEGFHVVAGTSSAGVGPTVRFTVELDPSLGVASGGVVDVIEDALYDPRSWARDVRFVRVEDPTEADIRVLLAHPDVVDQVCGDAGLDTEGRYSCWTGAIAALNAWRWEVGAEDFAELDTYRRYLVNHEVGHGLGHGHVGCPARGALAPVMMQQSITTDGCAANGWPYPDG